ncbi:MAG TPA: hypothetical protein VH877_02180 [Polyangia bacterium]|nr:hypothetical protein [Polyangia bacterium]
MLACGPNAGCPSRSGPGPGAPTSGYFPAGTEWDRDISRAPVDPESPTVITTLEQSGGWGTGEMRIDFSIEVLAADQGTPLRAFTPTNDFFSPDCDQAPVPLPAGGALEGETGYECLGDGDCHLLVVYSPTRKLYEMWRANIVGNSFRGGCLAVWDLTKRYDPLGRGDQCTSADAAGFPIAPLLFSADEVAAGTIAHAIRFILPNERIRARTYVRPATHAGNTSGAGTAPPYGVRLRLRANYPLASLPNEGARVVARALQKYGMLLSDGGNIALTAQSDRFTQHKWAGLLDARDLAQLEVGDFEMIAAGDPIPLTFDCVRK